MTAGHGICHSEHSTPATTTLHGVQLWIALPDADRETARGFHHGAARTVELGGARVTVFVGDLAGESADAPVFSPLLGAEILLDEGVTLDLGVDESFEHGVLVDSGIVSVDGIPLAAHELGYVAAGPSRLSLANLDDGPARLVLLGGTPFTEEIAMWWNFVGRDHDDITAMREQWAARSDRYGAVEGYDGPVERLEAPPMPHVRIRPRGNPRSDVDRLAVGHAGVVGLGLHPEPAVDDARTLGAEQRVVDRQRALRRDGPREVDRLGELQPRTGHRAAAASRSAARARTARRRGGRPTRRRRTRRWRSPGSES